MDDEATRAEVLRKVRLTEINRGESPELPWGPVYVPRDRAFRRFDAAPNIDYRIARVRQT